MTISRRAVLLGIGSSLAAAGLPAFAEGETLMGRLIRQSRSHPAVAQRIEFISAALLGTKYRANTLVGGPKRSERFVVRADAFDCVTYCETVLAAAMAQDFEEFQTKLREIRYHNGVVAWRERNHYFYEWSRNNVEGNRFRAVPVPDAVRIEKAINWMPQLGLRHVTLEATPAAAVLANKTLLMPGDVIGFLSGRARLDYFHVGFVAFGKDGELMLRHAAQSRGRVLDERMDRFVSANRVKHVTLLRAADNAVASSKL